MIRAYIHVSEITYGRFSRSIALPFEINENKVKASFSNGLLTIKIEKIPEIKETIKTIPIIKDQ